MKNRKNHPEFFSVPDFSSKFFFQKSKKKISFENEIIEILKDGKFGSRFSIEMFDNIRSMVTNSIDSFDFEMLGVRAVCIHRSCRTTTWYMKQYYTAQLMIHQYLNLASVLPTKRSEKVRSKMSRVQL